MSGRTYWFVYRVPRGLEVSASFWKNPTGGLVIDGYMLPGVIASIAEDRYHPGPTEKIWIMEARRHKEIKRVVALQRQWQTELTEFLDMMEV